MVNNFMSFKEFPIMKDVNKGVLLSIHISKKLQLILKKKLVDG